MSKYILIGCFLWLFLKGFGQTDTMLVVEGIDTLRPNISMIGSHHNGKNYLRWAPNNASLWFAASSKGYIIDRYIMGNNFLPDTNTRKSVVIKPWPIEQFRPYLASDEENLLAAGQCLYGVWESTKDANTNIFSRVDEAENRYSIAMLVADMDSLASRALGLSWIDEDVRAGQNYLYFLKPASDSLAALYSYALSIEAGLETLPKLAIDTIEEKEKAITLYWEKYENAEYYTAYWVERKGKNEPSFKRITKDPIVPASSSDFESFVVSFQDSVANYVPYEYRLIGITPFGFTSAPSAPISAMGRDRTPPQVVAEFTLVEEDATLLLTWKAPKDKELDHFDIYRALKIDGFYEKINPKPLAVTELTFRDINPAILKSPYYMVATVDTAGNSNFSVKLRGFLRDTIAPAPPVGLKGTIDSLGVVRLTWDTNLEPDLEGYYIYYANQIDHQFINLTGYPVRNNAYIDTVTLKTLTEHVYYKVTAADQFNHISRFSEAIEIKRPDTIPPSPAQIIDYTIEDQTLILNIQGSLSKDAANQEVYRKLLPSGEWELLGALNGNKFIDKSVSPQATYQYRMKTMDDDGNQAKDHEALTITILDKSIARQPILTEILHDTLKKAIEIRWKNDPAAPQAIIYRSINDGPFVTLSKSKNAASFVDKDNVVAGRTYAYKIKHVMQGGKISPLSQALSINLKPKE
ncbi:MAG: hypothetical protein IPL23_03760 [Saprospiraceae bacterium]|nr:hypothetical protein [Saprospiraceae bacterium]